MVRALRQTLDKGESEAIALAMETDGCMILLDERDARRVAKDLGLKTAGVIGVLLRGYRDGEIESPLYLLTRLQKEAGFYLSDAVFESVKAAVFSEEQH